MTDLVKLEKGSREQFTLVTSAACDENPLLSYKNWAGTLVASGQSAASASGNYYKYETLPNSRGHYYYEWQYTISSNTFIERGRFEVVETAVLESDLYCNETDLVDLYTPIGESTLRSHELTAFIRDVMNEVDGCLGSRFSVPFATGVNSFPNIIGTITKNLVVANIMETRPGADGIPEWVRARQDRYRGMLDDIRNGKMTLVTSAGTVIGPSIPAGIAMAGHNNENYVSTFNMLQPHYQRIDPDRQDDEEDAL